MIRRSIEVDAATGEALDRLAQDYDGDLSAALADLVRSREGMESVLDQIESAHTAALQEQLDRSQRQFDEGKVVPWEQVKRRNRL